MSVFLLNLKAARELRVKERAMYMLSRSKGQHTPMWNRRSQQPTLALLLGANVTHFDPSWNMGDLGRISSFKGQALQEARVLCWRSGRKPWLGSGLYRGRWLKYYLPPAPPLNRRQLSDEARSLLHSALDTHPPLPAPPPRKRGGGPSFGAFRAEQQ